MGLAGGRPWCSAPRAPGSGSGRAPVAAGLGPAGYASWRARWRALLLATPLFALAGLGRSSRLVRRRGQRRCVRRRGAPGPGGRRLALAHQAILRNAWALLQTEHPWTGVGWGSFQPRLDPDAVFPDRPDRLLRPHAQPAACSCWWSWAGCWVWRRAGSAAAGRLCGWHWRVAPASAQGEAAITGLRAPRCCCCTVVGLHSLLEYPLWYAYFLLPTALGFGSGAWRSARGRSSGPRTGSSGRAAWGRCCSSPAVHWRWPITSKRRRRSMRPQLRQRRRLAATRGQGPGHISSSAAMPITRPPPHWALNAAALAAAQRTGHQLIDARLLIAWAKSLHAAGRVDRGKRHCGWCSACASSARATATPGWRFAPKAPETLDTARRLRSRYGWRDVLIDRRGAGTCQSPDLPPGLARVTRTPSITIVLVGRLAACRRRSAAPPAPRTGLPFPRRWGRRWPPRRCSARPSDSSSSNAIRHLASAASGWQSGTRSAQRFAPWMAAMRATPSTSPLAALSGFQRTQSQCAACHADAAFGALATRAAGRSCFPRPPCAPGRWRRNG